MQIIITEDQLESSYGYIHVYIKQKKVPYICFVKKVKDPIHDIRGCFSFLFIF